MKDFQQGGAGMNILACNSSLESVYIDQPYFIEHPGSVIHILYGWLVIFISFLFDKFLIKSSNILRFLLCSFLYLSIYLSIDSLIFSRLSTFVPASVCCQPHSPELRFFAYCLSQAIALHLLPMAALPEIYLACGRRRAYPASLRTCLRAWPLMIYIYFYFLFTS